MDEKKEVPNVILIVLDAVRSDHLSCYGYHRKTSPNIDKLAKQGILFENAFSAAEWSYPSHASIFTGKYPSFHKTLGKDLLLHKENTTIAEILNLKGYQTVGVTSNLLLSPFNGFDKGFQNYFVLDAPFRNFGLLQQSYKNFVRTLIYGPDWFTYRNIMTIKKFLSNNDKKPFFLFSNLYSCHAPYDPPRPFKRRFCNSLHEPPLYLMEFLSSKVCGHTGEKLDDNSFDVRKLNRIACDDGQYEFMAKELEVTRGEWDVVKSWYDGCISYLDYRIGELINYLGEQGELDNTLLIITSDHGENFGEHGLASHQFCLYDSLLHVPLIMVYPDIIPKGRKISSLVSTVDIFPSILDILNIEGFQNNIQGKSLFPFENRKIHDFICAECGESVTNIPSNSISFRKLRPKLKPYDKGSKCVRTESHKYILSADGREELYDIRVDPAESVNIASKHPDKVKHLRKLLEDTLDISYFGPRDLVKGVKGNEIVDRLQALGYI